MKRRQQQLLQAAFIVIAIAVVAWQRWGGDGNQQPDPPNPPPPAAEKPNAEKPNAEKASTAPKSLPPAVTRPNAAHAGIEINTEHILRGQINKRGDLVGMHHLPSAPKTMRVDDMMCDVQIEVTSDGGPNDVVTARIRVLDPKSKRSVREKFSTLYPAAWTEEEILAAIRVVHAQAAERGRINREGYFSGQTRGIRIDGYLTRDGQSINTAYPVLSKSKEDR